MLFFRLPIIQGATFAFLAPTFSILSLPKWQCPAFIVAPGDFDNSSTTMNNTQSKYNYTKFVSSIEYQVFKSERC